MSVKSKSKSISIFLPDCIHHLQSYILQIKDSIQIGHLFPNIQAVEGLLKQLETKHYLLSLPTYLNQYLRVLIDFT